MYHWTSAICRNSLLQKLVDADFDICWQHEVTYTPRLIACDLKGKSCLERTLFTGFSVYLFSCPKTKCYVNLRAYHSRYSFTIMIFVVRASFAVCSEYSEDICICYISQEV